MCGLIGRADQIYARDLGGRARARRWRAAGDRTRTRTRAVEMAWWSDKLSLGGLQDIAGAVNKISESVKNMEKNFDSALGLEAEKRDDDEGKPYLHAAATVAHTPLSPAALPLSARAALVHCCVREC